MKTFLTAAILGLTGLAGAAGADAQDVRKYRNDRDDHKIERRHHRGDFRRNREARRVERTWVPARTESVFSGYDHCGKPVYRTVCIPGHWATRPICD